MGVSADMDNTGRAPVFNNGGGEGTVTGISSPEEIIANVQQRQAQTKTIEDQKAVISQYLDNNTIEQMGGEDNYNWLMNVVRSGTPDEVQKAYQTVVSSTAATKRQEAEARQRTALVYTQGHSSEMTTPRSGNPNVNAVLQAAHDQNFDAGLALAVAAVESGGGDVNEIHMAGHDGMFQIEPETAQNYGVADKYPDWQTDPYQNAMAGIEVLKAKIDEKDGDTWAGVAHYNGGGDPDYLPKVQAAYDHTSNMADSVTTGGASYDGFRLTLPDSDEFTDQSGNVDGLTEDTHMKLRVLDNLCYQKFGQHLIVSSSYREGDPNNHGAGVAFDVSGGIVDDPDARQWLEQAGPAVGLFVIPEYQGEAGAEFAHGDNVHFSNVEPGIYGQTRDAEGHWSEEHAAPSIKSILNGSGSATSAVKGKAHYHSGEAMGLPMLCIIGKTLLCIFDKTILQGLPVIRQQEVLENDQNIGDVKHLQDTLFHKGEAVFNVDDFEAEKNKRGSSYTIQDYAKEWLARKTPNVKRDTAAYQALEKEIVQQMGNAYALTQKETKKAALKDDVVVTGDEFGEYKDLKELRDKAKAYYKKHLQGTYVQNPILGTIQLESNRVDFTRSGMGKMVATSAKEHKLLLVAHLKELIENADSVTTNGNVKNKRNASSYSYLHSTAIINGKKQNIIITIFTDVNGNKYYNHTLPDEEGTNKKEALSVPPAQATKNSNGIPAIDRASSTSIISQKAEKGNNVDELRNQLSDGGKQAYDYALDKLSKGNEKVAQSAKESAFIYARMAERWSEIMHEYGSKTYSPEDYIKAHPIAMNQPAGKKRFGEPITNMTINLDAPAPVITIKEKYAGMDWRDLRRKLPGTVEEDIVSKKNDQEEYIPYVNEATGNKVIVTKKGSLSHFKSDHTSSLESINSRQNTLHYEMIEAIPEIIRKGIWIENHVDRHNKALYVSRIVAPVQMGPDIYAVKLTVKKEENKYLVENGEYTQFRAYDIETAKELKTGSTSTNSDARSDHQQPIPILSSSNLSISDFLRNVNDNLGKPYIDSDGTPNYGIYFGDNKTGGVMYIGPDRFEQRAWHGSGVDFDLGKIRGAFDANSGAIHLFDAADQSSFIHESAHMFLSDMEKLAREPNAPAGIVADLQAVKNWAGYKPGQMTGYQGTALEKEFQEYAEAIREAKKTGNAVAIKAAEERWMHERFARGFERYLADGEAPTPSLKHVFETFMDWMVGIYLDLKNLGKKPPKEIQEVMARMITPKASTKYSVRKKDEQLTRSKEDLKGEIKEAFSNAKEIMDDGDRITFIMPNGSHIVVDLKNEIVLTDEELAQAKKEHHIDDNGNVVVEGYAEVRGKDAYMALAQGSRENTGFHEAYHLAEGAVLTDREKAAIKKAIPDAEKRADKYAEWVEARKHGRGTAWGKLFQKIKDFATKMKKIFTGVETVHDVFRQIESGKVWERNAKASNAVWTSVTNTAITGKTRVPIVDVSNWGRMNLTNAAKKKAIIEELKGASFKFIDSQGRFATKLDSKHFVNSSSSIQIHLKTRQKIFSNIGEILNNAIYVEKHPDVRHGKSGEYIELFSAVKDGGKVVLFRIVAKEGDKAVGRYNIGDVKFYDILQQKRMFPTTYRIRIGKMGEHPLIR